MYREEIFQRLKDLDEEASLLFPNTERMNLISSEEEAKQSALNDRIYQEFLDRFYAYERRYRP